MLVISADLVVSFTPEEIENFKKDHSAYQKFRKGKEGHEPRLGWLLTMAEIETELQSVCLLYTSDAADE